jgi:hypothetical protein
MSFFSGHASITASVTAASTYLAFSRSTDRVRPWLTLGIGTALTTMVGFGRVQAGEHFRLTSSPEPWWEPESGCWSLTCIVQNQLDADRCGLGSIQSPAGYRFAHRVCSEQRAHRAGANEGR